MKKDEILLRMNTCREAMQVTRNGVVYDECLAGPDGMNFILFREEWHKREDLERAVKDLRSNRDVGSVRIVDAKF